MAAQTLCWAAAEQLEVRDLIVLVPFAQLLPPARRAFAQTGGWMPRIDTTQTLAASLGPATPPEPGQISFDAGADVLAAAQLLRSQAWGAAWARRDPRGFARAAADVVSAAQGLARAAAALHPDEREAHWAAGRALLAPVPGPGATERLLGRVALEWASFAAAPATDRLFGLRGSGWVAVQAGGLEPLTGRLVAYAAETGAPCLVIDADPSPEHLFSLLAEEATPTSAVCDGFEHEAQSAAAQVLLHLARGEQPIALIAQDRLLVRRVRALLERQQVTMLDETGWKLSTTRAAAQVMALLKAARGDATTDALFDWLKAGAAWPGRAGAASAIAVLEALCRRRQTRRVAAIGAMALEGLALRAWVEVEAALLPLTSAPARQPLAAWLAALAASLQVCDSLAALQSDDAGRQVLIAVGLDPNASRATAWSQAAGSTAMAFDEFSAWIDGVLEEASFNPAAPAGGEAQVVITPLARAMLRPFAAMVFPGADDKHLGGGASPHALLSDAQAEALGLQTATQRRRAEEFAFAQSLALPRITFLRRRLDGADPLADSPLVERLGLALQREGRLLAKWIDPRDDATVPATPIHCTAPSAPALLPPSLSASSLEALRACPYRFFALNMLRLREDDELDGELEKRDYGNWLHAVLYAFHTQREAPADAATELATLLALARLTQTEQALADADFMPFAASFTSFAPRYVAWLHARDADGTAWQAGEQAVRASIDALGGTELYGVLDRIDATRGDAIQLIDYKTGSSAALRDKVKQPLEDTQLAFYAALMGTQTEAPMRAIYLSLDGGTKGIEEIEHKGVQESAVTLLEGLADDLQRLRGGAGLPALGEGSTCDYCEARGICRRDHWTVAGPAPLVSAKAAPRSAA